MSITDLRNRISARLDEAGRGDRGWFILTRVHVELSWLSGIAEYLEDRSNGAAVELTQADYLRLGEIIESESEDPGLQLRRHHMLVMDKPLRLLKRTNGNQWREIELTERGRTLAHTKDPASVIEQALCEIRFAIEPWTPINRIQEYNDFNLQVYKVTRKVLEQCEGYIDRNEFDFFLSRVRSDAEIEWAVSGIHEYRELGEQEQQTLHQEVEGRIDTPKQYQNWRDVALHTFSLFALGTSMIRDDQRLLLTNVWNGAVSDSPEPAAAEPELVPLRIPEPPETDQLQIPPAAPASNDGSDGESFVAKVLRSRGWNVTFYTHRRGYGFDLWARNEDRAMVIEVKSSLAELGSISLTTNEHRAAQQYGESYILALVENLGSGTPTLYMIQNPVEKLQIDQCESTSYVIGRASWLTAVD